MSTGAKVRVSHSSVQDFLRCPRRWYLKWVAGINAVGPVSRPLDIGRAFHKGQEQWWTLEGDVATRLQAAHQAFHAACSPDMSWEDRVIGPQLLTGYAVRYADDELRFHAIPLAERKVILPVLDPDGHPDPELEYTVVFDVLGYDADGSTVLVEHKTTSSDLMGVKFWQRFDTSLQLPLQMLAALDSGREPSKLVVDVVRAPVMHRAKATPIERREFYVRDSKWGKAGDPKPGTRLRDETREEFEARAQEMLLAAPDAFFARKEYFPNEETLAAARLDVWSVGRQMLDVVKRGGYAPRSPDGCEKYGSVCEYDPTCWRGAALTDTRLYAVRSRA